MSKTAILKTTIISAFLSLSATAIADDAGKKTYDEACGVCHNAGIAGAPKFGDAAAWAPALLQGQTHYTPLL